MAGKDPASKFMISMTSRPLSVKGTPSFSFLTSLEVPKGAKMTKKGVCIWSFLRSPQSRYLFPVITWEWGDHFLIETLIFWSLLSCHVILPSSSFHFLRGSKYGEKWSKNQNRPKVRTRETLWKISFQPFSMSFQYEELLLIPPKTNAFEIILA